MDGLDLSLRGMVLGTWKILPKRKCFLSCCYNPSKFSTGSPPPTRKGAGWTAQQNTIQLTVINEARLSDYGLQKARKKKHACYVLSMIHQNKPCLGGGRRSGSLQCNQDMTKDRPLLTRHMLIITLHKAWGVQEGEDLEKKKNGIADSINHPQYRNDESIVVSNQDAREEWMKEKTKVGQE
ncbi:hypothetical protein NPIL_246061 [Nephila pilipes]|uniref:Uncharacterized protein n=1 Tax=Nephila pilipes TaxID=299642 RepID=A0A8X6MBL8_NEPPI|nr:hypothetical protein NPIL_246061 [Nephila pilipes]